VQFKRTQEDIWMPSLTRALTQRACPRYDNITHRLCQINRPQEYVGRVGKQRTFCLTSEAVL
jgi:hypothetical protein